MDGIVARSSAEGAEAALVIDSDLFVEPRVHPSLITIKPPALAVQAHCGRPLESNGAESKQTLTRGPGSWASTRVSHSVIWAFAISVELAQAVVPVATFRQYLGSVAVKGELKDPRYGLVVIVV